MLQRMLDNHSDLAVANDTHFIPRVTEAWITGGQMRLKEKVVSEVTDYATRSGRTGFFKLGLSQDQVAEATADSATFQEFACALYQRLAESRGKRFGGEKTPDYVRCIPLLHEVFPWARIVHLIRDGRDVALALLDWAKEGKGPGVYPLWAFEPIAVAALWWKRQVRAGIHDGRALGPGLYLEVCYEELVRAPEAGTRSLCEFLDLPHDPGMLEYHRGRARFKPGLASNKAWLPPTPGLRDWRTQMSERDVSLFECLAGDLLDELGYDRSGFSPSADVRVLAGRCQAWWRWKAGA
jgi:hypothetical protein